MLLWEARPGDGMHNTLEAEEQGNETLLTLSVKKPGGSGVKHLPIPLTLALLQQGFSSGDWIQQHRSDVNDHCVAFRVWQIVGTPFELCWFIDHLNRGTKASPNYVINDQLGYVDRRTVPATSWPV